MFEPQPDTLIDGRWRLESVLASGGMGSVWKGHHEKLGSAAAIKFMLPTGASTSEARRRFEREAIAAAQLKSPHVVRVLDHGLVSGVPYTVMELLEGEDLAARLRRKQRLSVPECCELLRQACDGLSEAHAADIVHRDLKPANLFITTQRGDDQLKILDFGVAKALGLDGEQTSSGVIIGSPQYMSPEQARAQAVDARSDLWSLGVIAFRLLTGKRLFAGQDIVDTVLQICTGPIPVASKLAADLPPAVDEFMQTALARDAAKRFQTAQEMASAFDALGKAHSDHVPIIDPNASSVSLPPQQLSATGVQRAASALGDARAAGAATATASLAPEAEGTLSVAASGLAKAPGPQRHRARWVAAVFALGALASGAWWIARGTSEEPAPAAAGTVGSGLPEPEPPPPSHSAVTPAGPQDSTPRATADAAPGQPPASHAPPTRPKRPRSAGTKAGAGPAPQPKPTPKPKAAPKPKEGPKQKHPIFGI